MTFAPASSLKAILGPTNTGKTYYAIDRMLAHRSGMIGLPLRLLAREVYARIVEVVGPQTVALVTGEERIVPPSPRYWVATVEAMPTDIPVECLAIDEVQVATDFDRGHVFTNRLLHARGMSETLLLGAATMAPVIRNLLPNAEIVHRPRLSQLTYAGSKKISRQPKRSAIVAFSAAQVYAIAELIRRERGGAAVVMGALSPRTRNAQVEIYQNGDVDFLVATDAIGMGLNLDVHHVAFADDTKFDGHQTRPLTPAEFAQIAGRAGRHTRDGTFGVTGGVESFDDELVKQLETHDFEAVRVLQWRNADLDFASIDALRRSLEVSPANKALTKVPVAVDQHALEFLSRNEAAALADGREAVELLWQCCQIPDYHGISPAQHGEIVTKVYSDLRRNDVVDDDWVAEQVRFCDNTTGDIDTLSNRIRQVRTWTFVANRKNWLADPAHWREKTRDLEDRLSDALHERLTQRFVDRRTSVLIRHLRDRFMTSPEINERGEVSLEGHAIGTIEGFRFTLARSDGDADAKGLRAAADQVVAPEIGKRAERLAGAPNEEFVLSTDGYLRWKGEVVAALTEGDAILAPRLTILADESLTGPLLERVQDRLSLWLRHLINTQLESVVALEAPAELEGTARGIAFRLYESLGIVPRQVVADEVKGLDQDVRGKMRKLGIKFGAHHIYVPASLKPAPRELAILLHALKNGGVRQPGVAELPQMLLSGRTSFELDPAIDQRLYEVGGFKVAGQRAVRIDILERLADIIRPLIAIDARTHQGPVPSGAAEANGFRVTVEMTSLLGCAGEDFASILNALGYRLRRVPKPTAAPEAAVAETPAEVGASGADAAAPAEISGTAAKPATVSPDDEDAAINEAAMGAVEGAWQPAAVQAPPAAEAAAVDTATADLGAPAPEPRPEATEVAPAEAAPAEAAPAEAAPAEAAPAEAAPAEATPAEAAPADPQFDEIWFPAGRRPDNKRSPRRDRTDGVAATTEGGEQREHRPRPKRFAKPDAPRGQPAPRPDRPPNGEADSKPRFEGKPRFDKGKFEKPKFEGKGKFEGKRNEPRPPRPPREPAYDPDSPFAALAALRNPKPE